MRRKPSRKFLPIAHFEPSEKDYYLLPFRFHPLDPGREVLVNEVGDFLIVPRGTAGRLANHEVSSREPVYRDLLAGFFLSETRIPRTLDVLAARYRTKKRFLDTFTSLHILVLTLRCNHTCAYCQVSRQTADRNEFDMPDPVLEAALDLVFQSPSRDLTIEMQGGEPVLAFDKIVRTVTSANERNRDEDRNLGFVLCTNLTLMSNEVLAFCAENGVLVSTSLDGPDFVHNSNRRLSRAGSHAEVLAGLTQTRAALGSDRVSALMTTSELSLEYPIEIVDEYLRLGFDHIFLRDVSPYGFATRGRRPEAATDEFIGFYKTALDYILRLNREGTRFVEDFASIILTKMLTPYNDGFVDLQSPAGLINSVLVYNYDGYVYASDESRMLAEMDDLTFRLGSVNDPYEELVLGARARQIADHWANESLPGCSDCGLQAYCGADPVRAHTTQGDMTGFRPTSAHCQKNMEIISHLLRLMDDSAETERIFRSWIN